MRIPCVLILTLGLSGAIAWPCCGVATGPVRFVGQRNLVVWDAATKTEHFIRDARFATEAADLGFIAPTPSRPRLVAVSKEAFKVLDDAAARQERQWAKEAKSMTAGGIGTASIRVLETQDVAGYRATILRASDAGELERWLKANGYPVAKSTRAWAAPYVRKGWTFTAFKVIGKGTARTGPVRMTFKTDRPFNPYRVPKENAGKGGDGLELNFIALDEYRPTVGPRTNWKAYGNPVPLESHDLTRLQTALKLTAVEMPRASHFVRYRDPEFPRAGTDDLFFQATGRGGTTAKAAHPRGFSPVGPTVAAAVVGGLLIVRIRRRRW